MPSLQEQLASVCNQGLSAHCSCTTAPGVLAAHGCPFAPHTLSWLFLSSRELQHAALPLSRSPLPFVLHQRDSTEHPLHALGWLNCRHQTHLQGTLCLGRQMESKAMEIHGGLPPNQDFSSPLHCKFFISPNLRMLIHERVWLSLYNPRCVVLCECQKSLTLIHPCSLHMLPGFRSSPAAASRDPPARSFTTACDHQDLGNAQPTFSKTQTCF